MRLPAMFRHRLRSVSVSSRAQRPSVSSSTSNVRRAKNSKKESILEGNLKVSSEKLHDTAIFCGDTRTFASALGFSDGIVKIHDTKDGTCLNTLNHGRTEDPKLPTTSIHFLTHPEEPCMLLASYASGYTTLWNFKTNEKFWDVEEDRQVFVNALNMDMTQFALGGSDAKINLYDMETHALISTFQKGREEDILDGHSMRIFALKFHPRKHTEMVSGGWDNIVHLWDVRQPQSVRRFSGPHLCGDGIDFLNDNTELITASWSKKDPLQRWDYRSGSNLENYVLGDPVSYLYSCRYCRNGNFILTTGGTNNMIRVFDLTSKSTIASYKNLPDGVFYAHEMPLHPHKDNETMFKIYTSYGNSSYILDLNLL